MKKLIPGFTLCLASMLVGRLAIAQDGFMAIPKDQQSQYHFNFEKNFFVSTTAEEKYRKNFEATLTELEKLKGKITTTPENLLKSLKLLDKAQLQFMRSYIYLYLRYATNSKLDNLRETQSKVGAEFNERTSFLQQELMVITPTQWKAFTTKIPELKKYVFAVDSAVRLKSHTLSPKEEELLSRITPMMAEWQGRLYQRGLDKTVWGSVSTPKGNLDVRKQEGAIGNSPDRQTRETGYKKLAAGYRDQRDYYAFALNQLVGSRNELSRIHHFKNNPDEVYFGLFLSVPEVKGLFEKLAMAADMNKRYQQLKADHIKKFTGFDEVHQWDLSLTPPGLPKPRFTIAETSQLMKDALTPFGSEYARELNLLLDPANGRLDIVGGENRVPGAFSWGQPGSQTSIFYSYTFEGYYQDVDTMIHESGHAVHNQLMQNNKVLPSFSSGAPYFTESFAMFNEIILGDYVSKKENDPAKKAYFQEKLLDSMMAVFPVARQASIEQGIYDGVGAGKLKTADDFDKMTQAIGERFSIWYAKNPDASLEWTIVHHFFTQPMYYVNYVFAQMLALKYYEMYKKDPKTFIPKYLALVRNGFDASPTDLLKKFLNLDLKDPKFVTNALSVVNPRIEELEMMYK